jgi:thiol peroxidase
MKERPNAVSFKGNPLTLVGPELTPGVKAPDFTVVDNDLKPVSLADYAGKIRILSSVPSLDTEVCDVETRRFNKEAAQLPETVKVLTISADLPFAQKRWCAAAGIDRVVTLSDYQSLSFAQAYGVLIKELKLLARCIYIVDASDIVKYVQLVPEITNEPDYEDVLKAVKNML